MQLMKFMRSARDRARRSMSDWIDLGGAYQCTIHDPHSDSRYLRERGLIPNVLDLARAREITNALDVGCGDGWLFDHLQPEHGCECDIACQLPDVRRWPFLNADVTDLTPLTGHFDFIAASLVLMWVDNLDKACSELFRIAADNATLVVALMHPASYRTGHVDRSGGFVVDQAYGQERTISDLFIAGKVGPFRYYHRPLSTYFNALTDAGWSIRHFREWSIDMADYQRHFGMPNPDGPARTDKLPMYAFLQCTKLPFQ
jgi:SAM-dependent methyltransferase